MPCKKKLNYPNPFNPQTQIRYHLPSAGPTKLAIFNLMGQEVLALVNGWQDAGVYNVQVDATPLPSGIYFYRLVSNDLHQVRKMVVSK
ncbi:MAG: T9SS type A sorting domain-containing protein [candidate division KSB1 bacterium]|nr:T9SS type A sorting domain-containing protein [candidate division KSB1 bacterium]MDZ7369430.1 T9SS type A sorting domain-containing protein [candidate division KSB1 bacterium]MDZ7404959.1 T9SS type A sorting domain-containing protein [candidate division KSB1 bacterium]